MVEANDTIKLESLKGLKKNLLKFSNKNKEIKNDKLFLIYKDRLDHELEIITKWNIQVIF